jgi:hypothetical protein
MGVQLKAMPHNVEPSQLVGFNNPGGICCGFILPRSGLLEPQRSLDGGDHAARDAGR